MWILNVYLDYFLERKKSGAAFKVFNDVISCLHHIIVSDLVLHELSKNIDYEETVVLFKILEPKLIRIKTSDLDRREAKLIHTHFEDALHIVLAKRAKANLIVTRNVKDFSSFKTKRPEDI